MLGNNDRAGKGGDGGNPRGPRHWENISHGGARNIGQWPRLRPKRSPPSAYGSHGSARPERWGSRIERALMERNDEILPRAAGRARAGPPETRAQGVRRLDRRDAEPLHRSLK